MASTLTDPGSLPSGGASFVTSSPQKLPELEVKPVFEVGNLDTTLSLTGTNMIKLGDGSNDGYQSDIPRASPFKVRPSDIKGLEKSILTELDNQVEKYDSFKSLITNTEGWIFLAKDSDSVTTTMYPKVTPNPDGSSTVTSPVDLDMSSTQAIIDSQNALVRALGDTYHLVGDMAAVLNNAAQSYVSADKATFGVDGTNVDNINPYV
jgi:hypothetical protein